MSVFELAFSSFFLSFNKIQHMMSGRRGEASERRGQDFIRSGTQKRNVF